MQQNITLSPEFRKNAARAIFSIILFIIVYILLVAMALALTALCLWGGFMLVTARPSFITLVLGAGIASVGVLVLIFLVKFMAKSHKTDRSHLVEITRQQEPALFDMVQRLVQEVGTPFPKKIYLSAEVNAAVFYDSSFWSMFLPVKKNLQIGMALVNTLTLDELKGVLAHEFGHFAQRSMKVGSYVYNVNQVIYNMLYDNDSYDSMVQSWANVSSYFVPFIKGAVRIVMAIQWVLQKMYGLVNLSYMGLSREMEFHADEVAAHVSGYKPLTNALLRMELAEQAYSAVIDYYNARLSENIATENIYPLQVQVLRFLAAESELPMANELPQVSLEALQKFNKSKLVVKDQWASHPGTDERIKRLEMTGIVKADEQTQPARSILRDAGASGRKLTAHLFSQVKYDGEVQYQDPEEFRSTWEAGYRRQSFDKLYNGYYDHKDPLPFDVHVRAVSKPEKNLGELFAPDKIEMAYTAIALQNDLDLLNKIGSREFPVASFDYDGQKYRQKDAFHLGVILKKELEQMNEKLLANDRAIFQHFQYVEKATKSERRLQDLYYAFFQYEKENEEKLQLHTQLLEATQFIQQVTPFEEITSRFRIIAGLESGLKEHISMLLSDDRYNEEITPDIRKDLKHYLSQHWQYFAHEHYLDQNLQVFFTALHHYYWLLYMGRFILKKELLAYQAELAKADVGVVAEKV